MKKIKNKRWMIIVSGVLIMVLATAGFAVSGFKGHMDRRHEKGFVREKILSHMDYEMQELRLSPSQQVQYATIRAQMGKAMDHASAKHAAIKDTLLGEMAKDSPDIKTMADTIKHEIRRMPDMVTIQIDYMLQVYDILTPAQQAQLVTKFKAHMDDHDDCRS